MGISVALGSVAVGANIVEKHFTKSRQWPGPDNPFSIEPKELKNLVEWSKEIWKARGGKKDILEDEKPVIDFAYACVVAIKDIHKGEALSLDNIWVKRPGTGEIFAKDFENVLGKIATVNISENTQLAQSMFK